MHDHSILLEFLPSRGGGHSHLSVDIICLYYDPLFKANLVTQWPRFSLQSTLNNLFFQNFNVKFQIRAQFVRSAGTKGIFTQIQQNLHQMTPFLGTFTHTHTKKKLFFFLNPTPAQWPFFYKIPHWMPPGPLLSFSGRHIYNIPVTFIFECPLPTAPSPCNF